MREILFRGKRKDNGEWVYGNYAVTDNNEKQHFIFQNKAFEFEVDPETVGQYTGITDDNEKKIFEGDILGVTNDDPDYDYITKVYLDCDTLCVDVQGQDYDYTSIGFAIEIWDDECDQVEIIGNIYDNPELLEV
jgi:uncharacterized phage protein (TIGR01671 family)|nr:MAG TPA: YopX protein [Caudoviricetes sp.]